MSPRARDDPYKRDILGDNKSLYNEMSPDVWQRYIEFCGRTLIGSRHPLFPNETASHERHILPSDMRRILSRIGGAPGPDIDQR